jgi:hypothetical protein
MAFKPTEFTVRDILLDELRKRGVHTGFELSFTVPSGYRPPDGLLIDGGTYVLETKLGGEADYFEDISRLTEWIKLRTAPIRGAFAVLFPRELRRLPWESLDHVARSPKVRYEVSGLFRDERPGDRHAGSLAEIANWIAEHVLRPPVVVEPDTGFVIRVLAGAVGRLTHQMRGITAKDLEDIFGGRPVFQNILEVGPGRLPLESLRQAAAYLLINQLIFYGVLSRGDPDRYPAIDPDALRHPADLAGYFQKVLEVDYAPTFGFDVASRLPPKATDTVRSVLEVVLAMGVARLRQDVLGKVFHNLIPLSVRKPVAAYYTNKQAADLLAALAVRDAKDRILDPACGSGTLLVASYQQKRQFLESAGRSFSEEDHERFLGEEVTGIDIMPFAAHLAVVHLSLQAPRFTTQRVRVAVWDSTDLDPGDAIPSITRELARAFRRPTLDMFEDGKHPKEKAEYVMKGTFTAAGFGGDAIHLEPVDVVIMNPPFTSSDRLGAEYKKTLKQRFGEQHELYLRGKMGFQGHFLVLADKFLKPGGRVAAVLPQTTLTGEAFGPIVDMFRERYTIHAVVVGLGRSAFSENTALSEILLVAEKRNPPQGHRFALLGTKKSPTEWSAEDVEALVSRIRAAHDHEDALAVLRWIPQRDLSIERGGLTRLLSHLSPGYGRVAEALRSVLQSPLMIPYGEYERKTGVCALISPLGNRETPGPEGRGGVYYGTAGLNIVRDESRALKNVDRLILEQEGSSSIRARDRVTGSKFSIPASAILPTVRRLSYYASFDVSKDTDFLIGKSYAELSELMTAVYGSTKAKRFVSRIRERWATRVNQGMSQLFLAYRINVSAPGTHHIAVYTHAPSFTGRGAWGFRGLSRDDAKLLCLWFNSSLFLIQLAERRTQTEGTWWRFDKRRFALTKMPDVTALRPPQREILLRAFDELRKVSFPSLLEQLRTSFDGRRKLDAAWLSALGVPESEQRSISDALHAYLYETLETLRRTMGKD